MNNTNTTIRQDILKALRGTNGYYVDVSSLPWCRQGDGVAALAEMHRSGQVIVYPNGRVCLMSRMPPEFVCIAGWKAVTAQWYQTNQMVRELCGVRA